MYKRYLCETIKCEDTDNNKQMNDVTQINHVFKASYYN